MASLQRLRLPLLGVGASAIAYWQHCRTTTTCLSASDEIQSAYAIGRTLGEGYYATVKLAKSYATGISYALKLVDKKKTADAGQDLEREVCVLKSAGQHRNLVSLVEEFDMPATKALVLELATGGELFDKLADEGSFSEHTAAELLRQVAEALQHLHQRGIVHNDLKPENLLLSCKGRKADLKLCDFGLARFIGLPPPSHAFHTLLSGATLVSRASSAWARRRSPARTAPRATWLLRSSRARLMARA